MSLRTLALLLAMFFVVAAPAPAQNTSFRALCYHDIDAALEDDLGADPYAVGRSRLIAHFEWLRANGYRPVSLAALLEAQRGGAPLPDKAVLLTFDDGFESFYTTVYPLLKLFGFPAVVAIVGRWIETGTIDSPLAGREPMAPDPLPGEQPIAQVPLMSWAQLREVAESGLVEIASHTYDLHSGIPANPQGNLQPAHVARRYLADEARYETDDDYRARLAADFRRNSDLIEQHTGRRPRAIVWPYGRHNEVAREVAAAAGMPVGMSLDPGASDVSDLGNVRRIVMTRNPSLQELAHDMRLPDAQLATVPPRLRVTHVDLDYVHDADPQQQERNLDTLVERIRQMAVSTVFLQAFADPNGDGVAEMLYFPNRRLPMRADLFNRVAWQLATRAGVEVYAWLPLLAFDLREAREHPQMLVQAASESGPVISTHPYRRLSPFDPKARRAVSEIYEDLARHAVFAGILIHDDAALTDFDDAGPLALRYYADHWNLPASVERIRADPTAFERWTRLKTLHLADFSDEVIRAARRFRGPLKTARNIYATAVLDPRSEAWLAQSLPVLLPRYDYLAVMAMPYMERARDPEQWLRDLVERVRAHPGALESTVFELQSMDWKGAGPHVALPTETLVRQMLILQEAGVRHYGYYPDDFPRNHPDLATVRKGMSLRTYPYREPR